ncbi:hypothetical protein NDU88_005112 [Pleurodeles waltl]|uniref:Uncharacterized protein n=1 Tax=Pleurodeles waltl TaxID=8319 RepID=A0AAV7LRA1_PLEWA|nr:hypothetical protein NDU88_005112 [Pleurodeles waltl]
MASQRGRGARRTMTPLMFRILAVAFPELDGCLRASRKTQGASSGGGAVAPEHEGAASHMALEGDTTESEFTSGTEGKGSSMAGTGAETSDTDSSSDGSSLVAAATSVPPQLQSPECGVHRPPGQPVWHGASAQTVPPPEKHQKLASARREWGKTPATKAAPRGPVGSVESAVTPSKVGKGDKNPGKSGKSSTAEKTAIIPAGQEATASPIPAAQEATASPIPAAQEATASPSPAAQDASASPSPAAQEASTAAQEATASTSPAGP